MHHFGAHCEGFQASHCAPSYHPISPYTTLHNHAVFLITSTPSFFISLLLQIFSAHIAALIATFFTFPSLIRPSHRLDPAPSLLPSLTSLFRIFTPDDFAYHSQHLRFMAEPGFYMPVPGEPDAPLFDPAHPSQIRRYFAQLEHLFKQAAISHDQQEMKFY